ncbi:hypothetical protein [Nitrosopumilus ureiphilus]|uniref:Uncharacterized protein n=1 Tax=Nitrosopumilus ureiphilus TaxID=1470067 RepID=A0A7D5REC7_9ARCH|nr:hypothetical protein [Nitrosopumilus ureiphilus]QLH07381.1 hypothetical protein C5F50_10100 [Nitrosopumilus ureiphilus]
MNNPNTEKPIDFYGMWKGYTDSIYTYVEKAIPQYHQSITNLAQEYIEAWKNISCSSIDIQRSFATKKGISPNLSDATLKIAHDIEHQSKKIIDVQNKVAIASIDATKQTLSTMNTNSNEFAALNRNIIEIWPSLNPSRS